MIIAITGTPGTGKTRTARKLEKLGFNTISGKTIVDKYDLAEFFDEVLQCKVVDEKKFADKIIELLDNLQKKKKKKNADYDKFAELFNVDRKSINEKSADIAIDSHLSHYIPKKYIDLVIATKCDISELKKRLQKRRYSSQKLKDNIDSEIFDVCAVEAREFKHKVITLST